METARVDIRKLQLLNDRINQCLDALNQVRLTVHGLSHSGAQAGAGQGAQLGQQFGQAMGGFGGVDPRFGAQGAQGYGTGLSHTPFASQPPFVNPIQQAFGQPAYGQQQFSPFAQQAGPYGAIGSFQSSPWQQGGLSHSELEGLYNRPVWADPMIANRVKETFPFVGYALPPIVSLY